MTRLALSTMLDLILDSGKQRTLRILCIGAHCDDIEIGCGATLRALQASRAEADHRLGGAERHGGATPGDAARHAACCVRPGCRGELLFRDFPDGRFPAAYAEIKGFCESLKRQPSPGSRSCATSATIAIRIIASSTR